MRMIFLGTGGGRITVTQQLRATGGIILELDGQTIHIDPGPGALVRAKEHGINLEKVTCVVVSHAHPDHYADAEMVIEAMTQGATHEGGVFIGNEHAINGGADYRPVVSPYHLRTLKKHHAMKPGDVVNLGNVKVTAVPTSHGEPKTIGFVFEGSRKIGYTSDGSYFSGQENHFKGCDYLILNVLRPRSKDWPRHMNTDQAARLVELAEPKTAIITHFGILMLKAGPAKEAKYIEEKTGVKTIAAKDGMVISGEAEEGKKEKPKKTGLGKWME